MESESEYGATAADAAPASGRGFWPIWAVAIIGAVLGLTTLSEQRDEPLPRW